MSRINAFLIASVISIVLFASPAGAVSIKCNAGAGLACFADAGDVLADGFVVHTSGNDTEAAVEAAIKIALGGTAVDLTLYGKSDDNPTLFSFTNYDQGSSLTGSKSGTWSTVSGALISYISVKAANSFIVIPFNPAVNTGSYSTLGILNNGNQQPTVSHISFWQGPVSPIQDVPEPFTAVLLGAGLVGAHRLRKRAQQ